MLGYPVLLRLLGIFELDPAFLAAFVIRIPFLLGPIFRFQSSFVLPLVLGTVPLGVLAREPRRLVLGSLLVRGIQDGKPLRMSHITGLADPERLSARAGMIGWQADEVVCREVPQAEATTWTLDLSGGTRRAGSVAARS